jgi:hypothetical protein
VSDRQLSESLDAMLELGSALIVATVAPDGEPRAGRASAWSVVDAAARRIRVAVGADDPAMVANLRAGVAGGYVAITGADVATLRSVQLKGRVVAVEAPSQDELDLVARHTDVFVGKIHVTDGHSPEVVRRFLPTALTMVELVVEEAYDQTPGPSAGAVLPVGTQ